MITELQTPEPIDVTIELFVGEVRIVAGDRGDTVVEVRPSDPAKRDDVTAAERTGVEYAGGRLLIKAPRSWRAYRPFGDGGSVDVEVALPTGSRIAGTTQMGAFRASGTLGSCRLKTAVGDIDLERTGAARLTTAAGEIGVDWIAGDAELSTATSSVRVGHVDGGAVIKSANGDTRVGEAAGDVQIKAANGGIAVERALGSVTAKTAMGDIRVGGLRAGSVDVGTGYGEITIGIAGGTAAWLDLQTHFGHVRNALQEAHSPQPGEGAVEVRARTGYGDITIMRSAPVPAETVA